VNSSDEDVLMSHTTRMAVRQRLSATLLCFAIASLFLQPADAAGQKRRKGFILNLGLGPSYTNYKYVNPDFPGDFSESKIGIGTDFKIGHAATDQLLIYYSNDASFFSVSSEFDDVFISSGLSGVGVTYFLKPAAPSSYVDASLGFAAWNVFDTDEGSIDSSTGLGLSMGGGFEFARHWLIDGDLVIGRPRGDFDEGYNTTTLRIGVIWLLY
jgi:hypothetical protein